jgi:hypothetical protein
MSYGVAKFMARTSAYGVISLGLVLGTGPGCVTSQVVPRPAGLASVAAINDAAKDDPPLEIDYTPGAPSVDLTLREAQRLEAADGSEVSFIDRTGARRSVDGTYVRSVRVTNHTKGALQGLVGGVLVGVALGVVLGAAGGNGELFSAEDKMWYLGLGFGALGGFSGALTGAYVGQRRVFVFED